MPHFLRRSLLNIFKTSSTVLTLAFLRSPPCIHSDLVDMIHRARALVLLPHCKRFDFPRGLLAASLINCCSPQHDHPPPVFYLSEAVLFICLSSARPQRSQPNARIPELFVLLHSMLFTNIQLDDFSPALAHFSECIVRPSE
jgi:hypothetical protein